MHAANAVTMRKVCGSISSVHMKKARHVLFMTSVVTKLHLPLFVADSCFRALDKRGVLRIIKRFFFLNKNICCEPSLEPSR